MSTSSIINISPLGFPWKTLDPFLFCVHHQDAYPAGNGKMGPAVPLNGRQIGQDFAGKDGWNMYHGTKVPGFPAHPHCGFETVTIARKGLIDHSDSLGAAARFGNGDVQWMTAGKGVQHSEMFPLLKTDTSNPFELFQIWLNLPRAKKKANPHFGMIWAENVPKINLGNGGLLEIISGTYNDTTASVDAPDSWAADPQNHVWIWTLKLPAGANFKIPATDEGINRSLYFYEGSEISIDGKQITPGKAIELRSHHSTTVTNGVKTSHFLLLQGRPINEPVVQYGPFVVNQQHEVQQVMMEYQRTQFGGWPWPTHEHAHAPEKGRFALHVGGRLDVPRKS